MEKYDASPGKPNKAEYYYSNYASYSTMLRTWFVTFGIGCLYLGATQNAVTDAFKCNADFNRITWALIVGVFLQVGTAIINKTCSWISYRSEEDDHKLGKWVLRISASVSRAFWIDIVADVLTAVAFAYVIYSFLNVENG